MVLIRMLLLSILRLLRCVRTDKIEHDFKVSQNQGLDLAGSEPCLISSVYKPSRMICMGSCNSDSECLTAVYDQSKGMIRNCFMYNRYFKSSELIPSSTSILYEKKISNYFLKNYIQEVLLFFLF